MDPSSPQATLPAPAMITVGETIGGKRLDQAKRRQDAPRMPTKHFRVTYHSLTSGLWLTQVAGARLVLGMQMSRRGFLALMVAVMVIPILAGINARATPSGSGKIVFVSNRDTLPNGYQIYVMNADGSNVIRLTGEPGGVDWIASDPAVSPDGNKIAFSSTRDGSLHIYMMNVNGSGMTRLTTSERLETQPAFSPDGRKIVFVCSDRLRQICVMNSDGSSVMRLTNTDPPVENTSPKLSPDGRKIVFSSNRGGPPQIYTMNIDGSNVTRLTSPPGANNFPAFSPDGRIAFSSVRVVQQSSGGPPSVIMQIYRMHADGSNVSLLTNRAGFYAWPTFSPDGRKIAFSYAPPNHSDEFQIFLMDAEGSNVIQLTNPPGTSMSPAFIP